MSRAIIDKEAIELYKAGKTDKEIGERFGVTDGAVWAWRKKRGLKSNYLRSAEQSEPIAEVPESVIEATDSVVEMPETVIEEPKSVAVNPAEPEAVGLDYDDLVYSAFTKACAECPSRWRDLLKLCEKHLKQLEPYLKIGVDAELYAVKLAAMAAVRDVTV